MDIRKISFDDLAKAVHAAYEDCKDMTGKPDPKYKDCNPGKFGLSVCLADGRRIDRGDVDCRFAIAGLGKIAIVSQLLTQMAPHELVEKAGACVCKAPEKNGNPLPMVPEALRGHGYHPMGVRAMSMVQPQGDPEGKWNNVVNILISLVGSDPELCDKLYEDDMAYMVKEGVENLLAQNEFYLYDDATLAIKLYTRLHSLKLSTAQLATLGATLAADGVNPETKQIVFDGKITRNVIGAMWANGIRKLRMPWMVLCGTPATYTRTGAVLAVVPGVMAVAAYAPDLDDINVPAKAASTVMELLNSLEISALSSARVEFVD